MDNRNIIQKLMDEAYDCWKDDMSKSQFKEYIKQNMSPKHLIAVQIGNLNYQVENGGFYQYYDNEYSDDIDDIMSFLENNPQIKHSQTIYDILERFKEHIKLPTLVEYEIGRLPYDSVLRDVEGVILICVDKYMIDQTNILDKQYFDVNNEFLESVSEYLR